MNTEQKNDELIKYLNMLLRLVNSGMYIAAKNSLLSKLVLYDSNKYSQILRP